MTIKHPLNLIDTCVIGLLLFLSINRHYAEGENINATAYTCCHLQDTFKDYSCSSTQPTSEFDTCDFLFFKALWQVPKSLKEDDYNELVLGLELRDASKTCKEMFRIHKNVSHGNEINTSSIFGGNATQTEHDSWSDFLPKFSANGILNFKKKQYNPSEYCFDRLSDKGEYTEIDIVIFDNQDECVRLVYEILYPIRYRHHGRERWIKKVFAAVAGLSCLFILANVIIYLSLRKHLNVSGWTEFAYFISLGLFSGISIPALLYESKSMSSDIDIFCHILSTLLQFVEIASYSSYLMVTFDVYWMLRKSVKIGSYGDDESFSKMRLLMYYFILLSIPLAVITCGILLDTGLIQPMDDIGTPHYGEKTCFSPLWPVSEYLNYGLQSITFLIILLSINMIFSRLSVTADVDDGPRVSLLSNMFFFTLTYWLIGLLQFTRPLFSKNYLYSKDEDSLESEETFWIVLEGFGYAQGIVVFVVFVFNRKTLRAYKKKSGSDGTLKEIFRHACCGTSRAVNSSPIEDTTPMSPLMRPTSMRRSTVRRSHLY